jgi:patatin-like phospholipase/acyl hydrolase
MALDPAAVLKPANSDRDKHLLPGGPKRVLALDGGGVRGLITLGILQRVEELLASQLNPQDPASFRLAHYFDLIGGTSTGSIIAASLALGHTVQQVRKSYLTFAPKIFKESERQGFFKPKFEKAAIDAELKTQFGDHTLDSPDLITGLAICAKRMDTGSPWVLFNHPGSEFWDKDRNKDYPLRDVIRASAAAPYFFDPHKFVVGRGMDEKGEEGIFVDGGVAGLNNPSVELLTLVLQQDYPFHWPAVANHLDGRREGGAVNVGQMQGDRRVGDHGATILPSRSERAPSLRSPREHMLTPAG